MFASGMQVNQPILALKPRGDVTRNPKPGYECPPNKIPHADIVLIEMFILLGLDSYPDYPDQNGTRGDDNRVTRDWTGSITAPGPSQRTTLPIQLPTGPTCAKTHR